MRNNLLVTLLAVAVTFACCKKGVVEPPPTQPVQPVASDSISVVSQFVFDGLSLYYKWAENMLTKKPTKDDKDPMAYFETLLNPKDTTMGWSYMGNNVEEHLADFAGEPKAFGWGLRLLYADASRTNIVAFVTHVFPNTPAYNAGIIRGNVISKIDGTNMVLSNYTKLFGTNPITVTVSDQNFKNPKDVALNPVVISQNPVLKDTVYTINGKKIGYLFYTDFLSNFNQNLYTAFSKFKAAGISDLIVDIRYNRGGGLDAASYLASLIAPASVVQSKSPFVTLNYNAFLNNYYDSKNISRKYTLGVYSAGNSSDPIGANLNLSKVYFIATDGSYSASELTTFCLKPYMQVVHIGSNTGGKYTASWTITPYNSFSNKAVPIYDETKLSAATKASLKDWFMQPIVAIYGDKDGKDFSGAGSLIPDYPVATQENNTQTWKPIGDVNDYLLAKAISLITGIPVSGAVNTIPRNVIPLVDAHLFGPREALQKESVIIERPQLGRSLQELREALKK